MGRRAGGEPHSEATGAVLRPNRLPSDGVVDGLPHAVHPGCVAARETVLVQGAGGGVASAAIMLARHAAPGSGPPRATSPTSRSRWAHAVFDSVRGCPTGSTW